MDLPAGGTYFINNVAAVPNLRAAIENANMSAPVIGEVNDIHSDQMWNVYMLENGHYLINNFAFPGFASAEIVPGAPVTVQAVPIEWNIALTAGGTLISPADDPNLFWNLAVAEPDSPVVLAGGAGNRVWTFTSVDVPED